MSFVRIVTDEQRLNEANQIADLLRKKVGCGVITVLAGHDPGEVSSPINDLAMSGPPVLDEKILPILPGHPSHTTYIRGVRQAEENLDLIRTRLQRLGYELIEVNADG